jgi:ribose-phosphate pyrophosphokinase
MELQLFTLNSFEAWGTKVQDHLEIQMSRHEEREFEDGENLVRSLENVRDRDVFIITSLYGDKDQSIHDKICRLLFFIGSLKDASARNLTVVIPYLAYSRRDCKTRPRDPITLKYLAKLFEAAGVDHVITMDVHNLAAFQNAFRIPTENLEARVLFAPYFVKHFHQEEMVVIAPDSNSLRRAEQFQQTLSEILHKKIELATLEKKPGQELISSVQVFGEVKNKIAIIVDDIICSGKTLKHALNALYEQGAKRIFLCATHGILTLEAVEVLKDSRLDKVLITDSIPPYRVPPEIRDKKLIVMDSSMLFARAMKRIQSGESVVELMESYPHKADEFLFLS